MAAAISKKKELKYTAMNGRQKAAVLLIDVFARPGAQQVVVERRAARGAAIGSRPAQLLHNLRNSLEILFQDQAAHMVMSEAGALAQRAWTRLHRIAQRQRQQAFN